MNKTIQIKTKCKKKEIQKKNKKKKQIQTTQPLAVSTHLRIMLERNKNK